MNAGRAGGPAVSLLHLCVIAAAAAGASAVALNVNGYYVFVLANVALLGLVGVGMNVLIGLSGQISFGHVGFYAIGAYSVAILGKAGVSFWLAWPAGALFAAAIGWLLALPALRVKGPYLAMITIAFGFIVEHTIVEMRAITGGQNGMMGISAPSLGALAQGERAVAVIAMVATALAYIGYILLSRGAWGAALRAVRDSEPASESVGLNPVAIKTAAFAISAFCAGAAGGLFAPLSGFVTPHTFGFSQSILFVLVVMIGGAGFAIGPIIGARDRRHPSRGPVQPRGLPAAVLRRNAPGCACGLRQAAWPGSPNRFSRSSGGSSRKRFRANSSMRHRSSQTQRRWRNARARASSRRIWASALAACAPSTHSRSQRSRGR